jgi:O-acetyl-ADP-ribose deacetylase (regulator of RNase III)
MKTLKGDLIQMALSGDFDIIAHGCNTKKNMGAGFALQVAQTFPEAVEADNNFSEPQLGNYSIADTTVDAPSGGKLRVANLYTQVWPGPYKAYSPNDNSTHRLNAIAQAVGRLISDYPNAKIAIPWIGSGYAGLNWNEVRSLLNKIVPEVVDFTIVEYQL